MAKTQKEDKVVHVTKMQLGKRETAVPWTQDHQALPLLLPPNPSVTATSVWRGKKSVGETSVWNTEGQAGRLD